MSVINLTTHASFGDGAGVGSREFIKSMMLIANIMGLTMAPHEAWLFIRRLKTLHLRMEKHANNAMEVARFLEAYGEIAWVRYPGLPIRSQHEIARNYTAYGLTVSLGAVDTLILHPASMTHAGIQK